MENYVSVGKLAATFGIKGELVLDHHLGEDASLEGITAIFLEEGEGKFIPYFIAGFKSRSGHEWLVTLEGVDTPEKARRFVKKNVWLRESDMKRTASSNAAISLLGYQIMDGKKMLGMVLEVIEQPSQILLRTEVEKKEVLVPVNESTLLKIDNRKEKIFLELPEGLLDIYLL